MIDFTGATEKQLADAELRRNAPKYEVKQDYKLQLIKSNLTLYKVVQVGTGKIILDSVSRKNARTYRDFLNGKVVEQNAV